MGTCEHIMIEQDKLNEQIELTPDQPQEQERQDVVVEVTGLQIELVKVYFNLKFLYF